MKLCLSCVESCQSNWQNMGHIEKVKNYSSYIPWGGVYIIHNTRFDILI